MLPTPSVGISNSVRPVASGLFVQFIGKVKPTVVSANRDLTVVGVAFEVAKRDFRLEAIWEGRLVLLDDSHEFAKGEFLVDELGFGGLLSIGEPPAHDVAMVVVLVEVDAVESTVLDEICENDLLLKVGECAAWTVQPKEHLREFAAVIDFSRDLEVLDFAPANDAREVLDCRTGSDGELAFGCHRDSRLGFFFMVFNFHVDCLWFGFVRHKFAQPFQYAFPVKELGIQEFGF